MNHTISTILCVVTGFFVGWAMGTLFPDNFPLQLGLTMVTCGVIGGLIGFLDGRLK